MKGDFSTLVWVNDKEGHEYVCVADDNFDRKDIELLSPNERATCADMNDFIGTDRW
jgi:hypothetical protein